MAKRTGFITVDRQLLNSEVWLSEPFTRGQAIVDLIGLANHADTEICKRGQLVTSERALAARWKWTKSKVRRFLRSTSLRTTIRTNDRTTHGTLITIENYDIFQLPEKAQRTTKRTTERTSERTETININNINNLSCMPDGMEDELKSLYGDRTDALIADVRRYYEQHPEKDFPGWPVAVAQFDANQTRWGRAKKKQKTTAELAAELFGEE